MPGHEGGFDFDGTSGDFAGTFIEWGKKYGGAGPSGGGGGGDQDGDASTTAEGQEGGFIGGSGECDTVVHPQANPAP